jgi:hypothetical protein
MLSIARAKMLFSENARVHTLIQKAENTLSQGFSTFCTKNLNSTTHKIAGTTFPQPLPYHGKQWATSSSTSSLEKARPRENPELGCSFLASHKNRRKRAYCHAENA